MAIINGKALVKDGKPLDRVYSNGQLVYGRNYILNSNVSTTSIMSNFKSPTTVSSFSGQKIVLSVQVDYDNVTSVSGFMRLGFEIEANQKMPNGTMVNRFFGAWRSASVGDSFHGRIYSTFDLSNVNLEVIDTSQPNKWWEGLYIQGITGTNVSVSKPKLEIGNKATDWTPAPEDYI